MFIGHFALGFAAKPAAPRVSVAVLFAAAQLADLTWPLLVAAGLEQVIIDPGNTAFTPLDFASYPYSHSLLTLIIAGAVFGGLAGAVVRSGRTAIVVGLLVVSHWLLDWITHRPDLPLYPGGAKFGLGLWHSIPATIAVEAAMFIVGVVIYARSTRPRDRIGRRAFGAFVAFLVVVYIANLGPPPPSVEAIVWVGLAGGAVLMLWARWFDRHRNPC
jgi:hypothetical protein